MNINIVTYVVPYLNDMNDMYIMKEKINLNEKNNMNDIIFYKK